MSAWRLHAVFIKKSKNIDFLWNMALVHDLLIKLMHKMSQPLLLWLWYDVVG